MLLNELKIVVKGGGEMASGVTCRLFKSGFKKICLTDISHPMAVRREVSFCEAVYDGQKTVEGVTVELVESYDQVQGAWDEGRIPIVIDPEAKIIKYEPDEPLLPGEHTFSVWAVDNCKNEIFISHKFFIL